MFSLRKKLSTLMVIGAAGVAVVLTAGIAGAATGATGPHSTHSVGCNISSPYSATLPAPTMDAVNRTTATDYQTVLFQPVIFKWSGTAWVQNTSGMSLYGTASDVSSPHTWYDLATKANMGDGRVTITLPGHGYWAVAYKMYWYSSPTTISGSDYLWASAYYTESAIGAISPASYCTT
jgi:hypothetical protein